jgi:hypothetical protein
MGGDIPGLKRGTQLLILIVLDNPPHVEMSDLGGGRKLSFANPMDLPGPPTCRLHLCNGLCFLPSAPSPLASILLSTRSSHAHPPTISVVNQLLFFTSPPLPPTHPGRGNPTPGDGELALDFAAFGVIFQSASLAVVDTVTRASSDDAAATLSAGGPGSASPLIFFAF